MKIAYVDNGLHSASTFEPLGSEFIPIPIKDIMRFNLCCYDILIVPFHTDQLALRRCTKKFQRYLKYGGILVLLGIMENRTKWVPFCKWIGTEKELNRTVINRSNGGGKILSGLSDADVQAFHAHGVLDYPAGESVISFDENEKILLIDEKSFPGVLLATTMDPDHHIKRDMTAMSKGLHDISAKLLSNIIDWSRKIYSGKQDFVSRLVKNLGIIWEFIHSSFFKNLAVSVTIVIVLIYLSRFQDTCFSTLAGIASIIGLQMSFIKNR